MRRFITVALLIAIVASSTTAVAQDYWTARSFRNRAAADRFIQQLARPIARRSAMVVPMRLWSGRNIHVVYLADARVEDPNKPRPIAVQNCARLDGIYTCAGTHAWMAAAGFESVLISVPDGTSMVLFDRSDFYSDFDASEEADLDEGGDPID